MNMQKTIIDPNPTNAKDMLEIMYYCKGFIDFATSSPFADGVPEESKDSFEKALGGCFSIGMAILDGSLSGKDKKHTSVNVKTMLSIYYYAYMYIDILQNELPEELTKDILHDDADDIKEKVRQKLLEMNETLYKSGDIPYEAFEKMKNMAPNNLKAEMAKFNITFTKLAGVAGICRQALYAKIEGKRDWKLTEMVKIYQFINTFENIDFDLLFTDYIERALNA